MLGEYTTRRGSCTRPARLATLLVIALAACRAHPATTASPASRSPGGIPAWPMAVDPGLDATCQPAGLLERTFPGWSGELCGIIVPSSSAAQRAATWRCIDARRATQPFASYQVEKLRADGGFGVGYIGVSRGGSVDVYRISYMADPCNDSGGCPARGGTEIVTCTKFFPICDRLDCFECDGQAVVASCRTGMAQP